MRTKEEEKRNINIKRKKQNKKNNQTYEEISKSNHLGGISFTVNNETDRLLKWKKLFYIRYFMHLGRKDSINVVYKSIKSIDNEDIEERYKINTTGKEKLSLSITLYHNTGRVLIQGNSRKEWVENEFKKMKKIVDMVKSEEEIEIKYIQVYGIVENILNGNDNELDKIDEISNKLVNDVIDKIVGEVKAEKKKGVIPPNEKKTNIKVGTKNLDEKKNKFDQLQIKNNTNAIENLETLIIEMQENYEKRLQEMDKNIKEIRSSHVKEMTEIKRENELAVKFAQEQIIVIKKMEGEGLKKEQELVKEVKEKDEQIKGLQEKINDMEVAVKQKIKIVERGTKEKIIELEGMIVDNREKLTSTSRRDINDNMKERLKIVERKIEMNQVEKELNHKNILPTLNKDEADEMINESRIQNRKRVTNSEVIIIMDSNRKYINNERFWRGHSCKIIQAGDVFAGRKVLIENDFKEAKFIYIHIGTNDIEKIESVDNIARHIIDLGKLAKHSNPNATIIISEIPVRGDYLNEHRLAVNDLMEKGMPESIEYVKHHNITKEMLADKKHIKENYMHIVIRNMKNMLRKILRNNQHTTRYSEYGNEEKSHQNEGKKDLNFNVVDMRKKISSLVEYLNKF